MKTKSYLKAIGPGLIFASSSIGTSHLVLSTRAGAEHGMIYFWIILLALLFKYPFFEFGPRYAAATGHNLLKGYKDQGVWAIYIFLLLIVISMFAVTGAIGAVSAGLLSTILSTYFDFGLSDGLLTGVVILVTLLALLTGGYRGLDRIIKVISVTLLITAVVAFFAVIGKGPQAPAADFVAPSLLEGAGLTLFIGLIGWMPTGIEASVMNSIWILKNNETADIKPTKKQVLFDFNLGYWFTVVTAIIFLIIGAFTIYGTGEQLGDGTTEFSKNLLHTISDNLGSWAFPIIAVAAFGTIYGTLITVLDAFSRCVTQGFRALKFDVIADSAEQKSFAKRIFPAVLIIQSLGGFALFYFSTSSMITMLEWATIISFLIAPILGVLNLRVILKLQRETDHQVPKYLLYLAYIGLVAMVGFTIYYLINIGSTGH